MTIRVVEVVGKASASKQNTPLLKGCSPFLRNTVTQFAGQIWILVLRVSGDRLDIALQERFDVREVRQIQCFVDSFHLIDRVSLQFFVADLAGNRSARGSHGKMIFAKEPDPSAQSETAHQALANELKQRFTPCHF